MADNQDVLFKLGEVTGKLDNYILQQNLFIQSQAKSLNEVEEKHGVLNQAFRVLEVKVNNILTIASAVAATISTVAVLIIEKLFIHGSN